MPRIWTSASSRASGSWRSEEHTSELQSHSDLVCRLLLEKKKKKPTSMIVSPTPFLVFDSRTLCVIWFAKNLTKESSRVATIASADETAQPPEMQCERDYD